MITKTKIVLFLILSNVLLFKLWIDRGDEITSLNQSISSLETKIELVNKEKEQAIIKLNDVNHKTSVLESKLNETNMKLEGMKGRQETVFKKPKLVERMINTSYNDFEKEIECVTGSKPSLCQ